MTDVFRLNGKSCKLILRADDLLRVLVTVTFLSPHIAPFETHIGRDA